MEARFLPEKLAQKKFLNFYASKLNAVEVNYTFRQLVKETTVQNWIAETPSISASPSKRTRCLRTSSASRMRKYSSSVLSERSKGWSAWDDWARSCSIAPEFQSRSRGPVGFFEGLAANGARGF